MVRITAPSTKATVSMAHLVDERAPHRPGTRSCSRPSNRRAHGPTKAVVDGTATTKWVAGFGGDFDNETRRIPSEGGEVRVLTPTDHRACASPSAGQRRP